MEENNNNLAQMLFGGIRKYADNTDIGRYYNYNLLPDLETFNRADTVNMSDDEMNKFRHIAGTKQALNDWGLKKGLSYTLGKEFYDITQDGLKDTLFDLKNDARALKLYFHNRGLDRDNLYNYVFKNYIEPFRK